MIAQGIGKEAMAAVIGLVLLTGCTSKVEKEFMASCLAQGAGTSYCSCAYDKLEDNLQAAEKNPSFLASPKFKDAMVQAIRSCKA